MLDLQGAYAHSPLPCHFSLFSTFQFSYILLFIVPLPPHSFQFLTISNSTLIFLAALTVCNGHHNVLIEHVL